MLQSHLTVGAQDLSPVVCHLHSFPFSGTGLSPACWWPSCLLFTDGLHRFSSLPLPPSPMHFQQPPTPSSSVCWFSVFFFFFCKVVSVCPGGGLCFFTPGVAEKSRIKLDSYLFGLPKVSHARLEQAASGWQPAAVATLGWQPACSLCVLWHGEDFHGLGVQGAKFQLNLVLHLRQAWL
jgi:hypothetical protein